MFEGDLTTLSTADLLESAADHDAEARRIDARRLEHAQVYADRFHPSVCPTRPGRRTCDGRERAVVLGGEGCPEIAEFAIAEFAVVLGISPRVAADYLGQALALRHRFPFTWARVQAGEATPWKARQLAAACVRLPEDAARAVDQRVAQLLDSITPYRLDKIIRAAKIHADPDGARAEAEEKARERGVFIGRSDGHGNKSIYIKAPAGAVIRHDATIAAIAEALKTFGDTRPVQHRRADAVGIIADARYTEELLTQARHHHGDHPAEPDHPIDATGAADSSARSAAANPGTGSGSWRGDEDLLADPASDRASEWDEPGPDDEADRDTPHPSAGDLPDPLADPASDQGSEWDEPGPDDEADRDTPHPSTGDLADPVDTPDTVPIESFDPFDPALRSDPDAGEPMDAAAQRALHARLARIRHDAYTNPTTGRGTRSGASSGRLRPGQTEIYVHLTDHTLATGSGVLRVEGLGPVLADQLAELVGHGPYTVKPVIDLHDAVSVDAYEIPDRIRERVKLVHPVEVFPFGSQETRRTMDLDHLQPYDPLGPPGQTSTDNLAPLGRFGHRVKTHAHGWNVRRLDPTTLEWTTPHGFTFHVDPTGTHRVHAPGQPADPD